MRPIPVASVILLELVLILLWPATTGYFFPPHNQLFADQKNYGALLDYYWNNNKYDQVLSTDTSTEYTLPQIEVEALYDLYLLNNGDSWLWRNDSQIQALGEEYHGTSPHI